MSTKEANNIGLTTAEQPDEQDSHDEFDSCVPKGHATAPEKDAERDVNIVAGGAF